MALTSGYKIKEEHNQFILNQVSSFIKAKEICANLSNPEIAEDNGFEPIEISDVAIRRHIKLKLNKEQIVERQTEYLYDFTTIPLAHKKERVKEYIKFYNQVDKLTGADGKELSENYKMNLKRGILRDIRAEIAEDLTALAKALADAKGAAEANFHTKILSILGAPNDADAIPETQTEIH